MSRTGMITRKSCMYRSVDAGVWQLGTRSRSGTSLVHGRYLFSDLRLTLISSSGLLSPLRQSSATRGTSLGQSLVALRQHPLVSDWPTRGTSLGQSLVALRQHHLVSDWPTHRAGQT